jgi:iron-sulfur cluster protein
MMSAHIQGPAEFENPRTVASKSHKENLLKAIRMSLGIESAAVRHNTQTFNANRYRAVAQLSDYDSLKDEARRTKERSIANLPQLIEKLAEAIRQQGGYFHLATTREDACRYTLDVCQRHAAKLVVKGKSMTSEEVRLNHALQDAGIEVAETDLAEFILQVADEQPSHIIAPAIHYSRERITELFKRRFNTSEALDTGEDLTRFARERLRQKFLHADVGITGANLIAADSGTLMLVESEGNIRMASQVPPVHIAMAGIEKIVASREDFGPFIELLAASGTGQNMTSYTSIISPPLKAPSFAMSGKEKKAREFHLVLIDNGRMTMREDPVLHEALYCIRCSACLNSCANFQTVGGHAFGGETYSGGIGGAWEAGTSALENARFAELCTGCSRCINQCPVRIDVPRINEVLRQRLNYQGGTTLASTAMTSLVGGAADERCAAVQKVFFGNYHWFAHWGGMVPGLANWVARLPLSRVIMSRWLGVDHRRELPAFSRKTLVRLSRKDVSTTLQNTSPKALLFADVYTNYGLAERGECTRRVLHALGVNVKVSECLPAGRAPLSQGMLATAKRHAENAAAMLGSELQQGRDIIAIEPSILALFRRDYRHLLNNTALADRIAAHSFDPIEYVARTLEATSRKATEVFNVSNSPVGPRIFFHAHCQQKTVGAMQATENLLRAIGFDVVTSQVECCGMAGSFGYKKEYYELSMAVGAQLFQQVRDADTDGERVLVASGTSCTEQLHSGVNRTPIHPIELLAGCLR